MPSASAGCAQVARAASGPESPLMQGRPEEQNSSRSAPLRPDGSPYEQNYSKLPHSEPFDLRAQRDSRPLDTAHLSDARTLSTLPPRPQHLSRHHIEPLSLPNHHPGMPPLQAVSHSSSYDRAHSHHGGRRYESVAPVVAYDQSYYNAGPQRWSHHAGATPAPLHRNGPGSSMQPAYEDQAYLYNRGMSLMGPMPMTYSNPVANLKPCEVCGAEHDGTFGAGRFCSSRCARTVGGLAHRKKRLAERGLLSPNDPRSHGLLLHRSRSVQADVYPRGIQTEQRPMLPGARDVSYPGAQYEAAHGMGGHEAFDRREHYGLQDMSSRQPVVSYMPGRNLTMSIVDARDPAHQYGTGEAPRRSADPHGAKHSMHDIHSVSAGNGSRSTAYSPVNPERRSWGPLRGSVQKWSPKSSFKSHMSQPSVGSAMGVVPVEHADTHPANLSTPAPGIPFSSPDRDRKVAAEALAEPEGPARRDVPRDEPLRDTNSYNQTTAEHGTASISNKPLLYLQRRPSDRGNVPSPFTSEFKAGHPILPERNVIDSPQNDRSTTSQPSGAPAHGATSVPGQSGYASPPTPQSPMKASSTPSMTAPSVTPVVSSTAQESESRADKEPSSSNDSRPTDAPSEGRSFVSVADLLNPTS